MSLTPGVDVPVNVRTKEENQERAFIAASRRKDRSLDARIESANRASLLHKHRTGRALNITRDIVESEAMYEEIDSNYQVKLQRMMQAQTLQLEQDIERKLFVAVRNNPQALHQRRATSLTPQGPLQGGRKMSLDLSQLRGSHSEPITSPIARRQSANVMLSPDANLSPSYPLSPTQVQAHAQVPSYVASPAWVRPPQQNLMQNWEGCCPENPMSLGGLPMYSRQFRDRLASAPTIPVKAQSSKPVHASRGMSKHSRVQSEPGPIVLPTMNSLSSPSPLYMTSGPDSGSSSLDASSSELYPSPACLSPHTPTSQASDPNSALNSDSTNARTESEKWSADLLAWDMGVGLEMFPHEPADQDYLDFSQYASTLDHPGQFHVSSDVKCNPQARAMQFGSSGDMNNPSAW
ncbi:hypothetical protein BJX99DRAFT_224891 [Aspergillus californicus]